MAIEPKDSASTESTLDGSSPGEVIKVSENVVPFAPGPGPATVPAETARFTSRGAESVRASSGEPSEWNAFFDRKAIEEMVNEASDSAQQRRDWYEKRPRSMGKVSRRLRLCAVGFAVAGGLCPLLPAVLAKKLFGEGEEATISAFGFVFIALAASAVLLDQAFGYSTSWMRSRLAELEIGTLL